jgi:uncharacterized membrane protein|tara:strand:+ start:216 stop:521 length:306 start_codon:yes stop_codon:yes gene_type:complete
VNKQEKQAGLDYHNELQARVEMLKAFEALHEAITDDNTFIAELKDLINIASRASDDFAELIEEHIAKERRQHYLEGKLWWIRNKLSRLRKWVLPTSKQQQT